MIPSTRHQPGNVMLRFICRLLRCCPKPTHRLRFLIGAQSHLEGDNLMARITTEQRVLVTVVARTLGGNVAPVDGEVNIYSDNPNVAIVQRVSANSAYIYPVVPGAARIVAEFDGDLDQGEERIVTLSGAIEVVAAEAVTGTLEFGEPTPIVSEPPAPAPEEPPAPEPVVEEPPPVEEPAPGPQSPSET